MLPIPRVDTDIGNSVGLLPGLSQAFGALCKIPQHLWILPVVEIVVILELRNLLQFLLTESLPVVVHLIGFPFPRIFVTVGYEATVVPILVHVLPAVKQLTCCHLVLLVFQLQVKLTKRVIVGIMMEDKLPTLSSKTLLESP